MSYAEEPRPKSNTLAIVLSIVGGCLLVTLIACGGLVFFAYKAAGPIVEKGMGVVNDTLKSTQTAQTFLANLSSGRLDAAYKMTTDAFQRRMTRQDFEKLVHQYPEIQDSSHVDQERLDLQMEDLKTRRFTYQFSDEDESVEAKFTVVKVDDEFKVADFTLEGQARPRSVQRSTEHTSATAKTATGVTKKR